MGSVRGDVPYELGGLGGGAALTNIYFLICISPQVTRNFEYKIDHNSKPKNRKISDKSASEYYAFSGTKKIPHYSNNFE